MSNFQFNFTRPESDNGGAFTATVADFLRGQPRYNFAKSGNSTVKHPRNMFQSLLSRLSSEIFNAEKAKHEKEVALAAVEKRAVVGVAPVRLSHTQICEKLVKGEIAVITESYNFCNKLKSAVKFQDFISESDVKEVLGFMSYDYIQENPSLSVDGLLSDTAIASFAKVVRAYNAVEPPVPTQEQKTEGTDLVGDLLQPKADETPAIEPEVELVAKAAKKNK